MKRCNAVGKISQFGAPPMVQSFPCQAWPICPSKVFFPLVTDCLDFVQHLHFLLWSHQFSKRYIPQKMFDNLFIFDMFTKWKSVTFWGRIPSANHRFKVFARCMPSRTPSIEQTHKPDLALGTHNTIRMWMHLTNIIPQVSEYVGPKRQ